MPLVKSKVKLSRSLGIALVPKANKALERRPDPPGQHGKRRRTAKKSGYGQQLLEKQRLRHQYFLGERQLRNYVARATAQTGNTADNLILALETRLDAVVLRAGFARTIYQARQFVTHGHVLVNGKRVNFPSASVNVGDKVSLRERSRTLDVVQLAMATGAVPPYLVRNDAAFEVELVRPPVREEIPVICELSSIVEFYAK